MYQKPHYKPFF